MSASASSRPPTRLRHDPAQHREPRRPLLCVLLLAPGEVDGGAHANLGGPVPAVDDADYDAELHASGGNDGDLRNESVAWRLGKGGKGVNCHSRRRVRLQEWSQHRPHKRDMRVRGPHGLGLRVWIVLLCFWACRCRASRHDAGGATERRHCLHQRRGCGRVVSVAETTMLAAGVVFGQVKMARRRGSADTLQKRDNKLPKIQVGLVVGC